MRYAISAVAAASGLLLLGLSFFGQPAVYLHQAGEQWNALMDRPEPDQSVVAAEAPPEAPPTAARNSDAAVARAERLQQEVARLQQELARQQAQTQAAAARPAAPPAPPPQATSPSAGPLQATAPQAAPPTEPAAGRPTVVASAPPKMVVTAPAPTPPAPLIAVPPAAVPEPEPALPVPPAVPIPERRVAEPQTTPSTAGRQPDSAKVEPPKPEPAKAEPPKAEPSSTDLAKAEPTKAEPSRQAAPKIALLKPVPAPPPLPQPSPPRQDPDDTQSVLARLRQLGPVAPPAQQAPPTQQADAAPPQDIRPRPAVSPLVPRLRAARAALGSGRIEDARRLLQQTQLQLVFGPVDGSGEDTPNTGRSAADVARALDALSANDVSLSRRYIDVAMGDLSGIPTNPPVQESARRASGYAPAYPPR